MTPAGAARTTIVTVAYKSAAVLPAMLSSIPAGVPVVVVDNASADDSGRIAREAGATVVRLDRNEGFGRGCNAGAAVAETEFLFFLNPDAALEPGALDALEAAADAAPGACAFNPRITVPSGSSEFKRRSVLLPPDRWMERGVPEGDADVPVLSGAALFCRRSAFEAVGGFDPAIFLYHEDDDLSLRLARDCGRLRFVAGAHVRHQAGHSAGRNAAVSRFKGYHMARSRVYAQGRHGVGKPWLISLAGAVGGLLAPHNLLSARRRAKHIGQVAGIWSARKDGGAFR
ncbi:glycosyl transferase [Zhengella mangrovi]|uniref:Glycosyl transferase n=1 Tax=Zhengella mangrovi TaxID=1982044 RepID=A0A2G1QI63_9HYPH|nr:glycosyltransferase family 2 protein [Zhengella mangrovi]PHP64898.1 glycosyl transferase [Zhengella mangrovi]